MNSIEKLTNLFKRFPGIGPRQAKRFVYFLLSQHSSFIDELIKEIQVLRTQTTQCTECFIYFTKDNFSELCDTCNRSSTDTSTLLVVSKDVDVEAIKRADVYKGRYFVLGGTLPFLEKVPTNYVRSTQLAAYIARHRADLREIIFALPVTPEGDNTRKFLIDTLPLEHISYKTLGRGLSTGTEIEYSDSDTIASAFRNRY
ncbi:MAG: recombination protein RecR, recombination protein RecR [Candidatus Parcubacteria bacterium]|jgi:recombination protein RecR